jgi:hypothetical protein
MRDQQAVMQRTQRRALHQQALRERRESQLAGLEDDRPHRFAAGALGGQQLPQRHLRRPEDERHHPALHRDLQHRTGVERVVVSEPAADRAEAQRFLRWLSVA